MGALLIDQWLAGSDAIDVRDDASISVARDLVRARGTGLGLDRDACEGLAAAVSELARNQLRHAVGGMIGIRAVARGEVAGLEVIATDRGPGIADPTAAFAGAARVSGSLGVGLGAAYRAVHELDADVRWGEGTCVRVRTFAAPVARSEVAVLGRPCRGESISGDHAAVVRGPTSLTIVIADGLGHGPLARDPADLAVAAAVARLDRPMPEVLADCHAELHGTRGVVMAIAAIDLAAGELVDAGIGNISVRIVGPDGHARIHPLTAGVIGGSSRPRTATVERAPLADGGLVVVASDGLTSRAEMESDPALLRRPPLLIAHQLVTRFGRLDDDILVVVAR